MPGPCCFATHFTRVRSGGSAEPRERSAVEVAYNPERNQQKHSWCNPEVWEIDTAPCRTAQRLRQPNEHRPENERDGQDREDIEIDSRANVAPKEVVCRSGTAAARTIETRNRAERANWRPPCRINDSHDSTPDYKQRACEYRTSYRSTHAR